MLCCNARWASVDSIGSSKEPLHEWLDLIAITGQVLLFHWQGTHTETSREYFFFMANNRSMLNFWLLGFHCRSSLRTNRVCSNLKKKEKMPGNGEAVNVLVPLSVICAFAFIYSVSNVLSFFLYLWLFMLKWVMCGPAFLRPTHDLWLMRCRF